MHRLENLEKLIFYLAKKMFGLEKKTLVHFENDYSGLKICQKLILYSERK